jgi:hypothetical protein
MFRWPIYLSVACSVIFSPLLSSSAFNKHPAFYHAFASLEKLASPVIVEIGPSNGMLAEWAKNHSNCEYYSVAEDAVEFLRQFDRPIDFLYLHRQDDKEMVVAYPKLSQEAIVMVDCEGKALKLLFTSGYKIILRGEQTILSRIGSDVCKTRFNQIYERKEWGTYYDDQVDVYKGSSGSGSTPDNAKIYLDFLQKFIREVPIESVVEVGCGDWQLSRLIDWQGIEYLGIDVVPSLIDHHNEHFSAPNIHFLEADGTRIELPPADLLICKDVLQHLPLGDIERFLKKLPRYKYAILVNDVHPKTLTSTNKEVSIGGGRTLDLSVAPFYLVGEKVTHYKCIQGQVKVIFLWKNPLQ